MLALEGRHAHRTSAGVLRLRRAGLKTGVTRDDAVPRASRLKPSEPRGWPRFSEPGSRSDTRQQENATDACGLLRLRRAGLKTGVTRGLSAGDSP